MVDVDEAAADAIGGSQYAQIMGALAHLARTVSGLPIDEMLEQLARVAPELDAANAAAVVDQFQLLEAFREVKRAVETIRERLS